MKVLRIHNSCNCALLILPICMHLPLYVMLMHIYQSNDSNYLHICNNHNKYLIINKTLHLFDGIQVIFITMVTLGHLLYTKGGLSDK